MGGIEVEDEGRGGGERGKGKKKGGIPAIKSRCAEFGTLICGSGMRARNLCSEGAAALSGVFWALLIPGNKTRVKFLIQAEILGLSALRSVIGAAFIHTRKLPSICSRVRLIIDDGCTTASLFRLCNTEQFLDRCSRR